MKSWKPVAIIASVVSILVGLVALGFTMPWDAVPRQEVYRTFETKEHAKEVDKRVEKQLDYIIEKLDRMYPERNP